MLLLVLALTQAPIELRPGMVITQSIVVAPKRYRFSGPPITIRGDNITVFRVDHKTGGLNFTGHYTPVGNPSIIVFLDLAKAG